MNFYSNGKLLLTAEYLVINGAKSLALPTKYGQDLRVSKIKENTSTIYWKSYDVNKEIWLQCKINCSTVTLISVEKGEVDIAKKLVNILQEAKKMNPLFLNGNKSLQIETNLEFNRTWGLGTSSTLINNIAQWANIDAFQLQFSCFGGSGYDIACANNNTPIIYSLTDENPEIKPVKFNPPFKNQLFFVYLNKKQNSRDAIKNYKKQHFNVQTSILKVNLITNKILSCKTIEIFEELIVEHENLLGSILKEKTVKEKYFNDYFGAIKSLGAWGGDFILVTGNKTTIFYFKSKGYHTVIPFSKMVK